MADIIKLKTVRKARDRAAGEAEAAANRAKFGRTKADRGAEATEAARRKAILDGAKRDATPAGPSPAD